MKAIFIYFTMIISLIILSPIILYRYYYYVVKNNKRDYTKIYKLVNGLFAFIMRVAGIKIDVEGSEHLEKVENGFLLVSNHQSYYDIPAASLALRGRGLSFVAKESLRKVWFIAHYMEIMNCLFLDRSSVKAGMKMIKDGNKLLKSGVNLLVFPEGQRTRDGNFQEFKAGSLKLATRVKAPIVPMSISNSYNVNPNDLKMKRGIIKLVIHQPILADEYDDYSPQELNDLVEKTIKDGVTL